MMMNEINSGEGPLHYKTNRIVETCELMEQVACNVVKSGGCIKKALWSAMAMKHLDRLGTKDGTNLDEELLKIENYAHRARTEKWIQK
jgi:hypothetical protein